MVSCIHHWTGAYACAMDKYCPDFEKCVFRKGEESSKAAAQDRNFFDKIEAKLSEPQFAIISTHKGFRFGKRIAPGNLFEYTMSTGAYTCFESSDMVVATYQNAVHCKQQLAAAQKLEKQLRPMWQAALEHAKRLEIIMTDAVYAIARDNEIK